MCEVGRQIEGAESQIEEDVVFVWTSIHLLNSTELIMISTVHIQKENKLLQEIYAACGCESIADKKR